MGRIIAVIAAITLIVSSPSAYAYSLNRTALSGKSTLMYNYGNWRGDCSPHGGVVRVASKPQHGTLTPVRQTITIKSSRFPRDMSCIGRQVPGFVVYYRSKPSFVGLDSFTIEVTYPGRPPSIDTFTVQVQ